MRLDYTIRALIGHSSSSAYYCFFYFVLLARCYKIYWSACDCYLNSRFKNQYIEVWLTGVNIYSKAVPITTPFDRVRNSLFSSHLHTWPHEYPEMVLRNGPRKVLWSTLKYLRSWVLNGLLSARKNNAHLKTHLFSSSGVVQICIYCLMVRDVQHKSFRIQWSC